MNHALSDHFSPARTVHQIGCGRLEFDVNRIEQAHADPKTWRADPVVLDSLLEACSEANLIPLWARMLELIDEFHNTPGPLLKNRSIWKLQLAQFGLRSRRVVDRLPGWPVA